MAKIRLDKYISASLLISRKDASEVIRRGRVSVNGKTEKASDAKVDEASDKISCDGKSLSYSENIYIMLNKPKGLVCSVEDARDKTVLSLFDKALCDKGLFPCGRLDKDTTGFLLMTTDGELSHRLLSPKHHAEKVYLAVCDREFEKSDIDIMKNGVMMDGKKTKPALLEILEDNHSALITLTEGKFHEIKRLCYSCGQKEVTALRRISFGGLTLDEDLDEGEWRFLTDGEIKTLSGEI